MKKIFTTAAVALFMLSLASCSDDDSSSNTSGSDKVLPSKVVEHDASESVTGTYSYNGSKLKSITYTSGDKDVFTYSGDNIVKSESSLAGTIWLTNTYAYNSKGQVTEHVYTDIYDTYEKIVFVYNSNGTISTTQYSGDTEAESVLEGTGIITIENGNPVKYAYTLTGDDTATIQLFTFDDKKSPWKNITGMAAIDLISLEGNSPEHNVLTEQTVYGDYKYTYVYNNDGYPTSSTESDNEDELNSTTEYFY